MDFYLAGADHAEHIASVIISTGEGVVEHLLGGIIPGMSAQTILSMAFLRDEGVYSPDNVLFCGDDDDFRALLFAYPAEEHRIPGIMSSVIPAKRLDPVRPILERAIPDTLYVNTFWVAERERGTGLAGELMDEALRLAQNRGMGGVSLFCWADNERALRFYHRQGFETAESFRPDQLALPNHDNGGLILVRRLPA